MLALSERQYAAQDKIEITKPILLALLQWQKILLEGRPRDLRPLADTSISCVVSTDCYFPDQRKGGSGAPGIGGVWCAPGQLPVYYSEEVAPGEMDHWIPRKTQIVMVEMYAVIKALLVFDDLVAASRVVFLSG